MITVLQVSGEPEARMYEDMLKQSGLHAQAALDPREQALRGRFGGASIPGEQWLLQVPEGEERQARDILSDRGE